MKRILSEDLLLLDERVKTLKSELFALGEEFGVAVNQSSETWHDNAPFDFARDKQSLLQQELIMLNLVRRESIKYTPKRTKKVQIGSKVVLKGDRTLHVMIGGNWIGRDNVDGYRLITCDSPVAQILLGRTIGDTVELPSNSLTLEHIS